MGDRIATGMSPDSCSTNLGTCSPNSSNKGRSPLRREWPDWKVQPGWFVCTSKTHPPPDSSRLPRSWRLAPTTRLPGDRGGPGRAADHGGWPSPSCGPRGHSLPRIVRHRRVDWRSVHAPVGKPQTITSLIWNRGVMSVKFGSRLQRQDCGAPYRSPGPQCSRSADDRQWRSSRVSRARRRTCLSPPRLP